MPRHSSHFAFFTSTLKRWVLVCLFVALPLCGLAASVTALLGARHVHWTAGERSVQRESNRVDDVGFFQLNRKALFVHRQAHDQAVQCT